MKFNEMNLIEPLQKAVQNSDYETATPIQEQTIPLTLGGNDILGCAQTGTGKTAAFVLPILQRLTENQTNFGNVRPIRALILAPTRELAIQNYDTCIEFSKYLKLRTTVIFGGVKQMRQVNALKNGVDILVATPGRLWDLIGQGFISLNKIEIFVLDEADRMLDMGFIHDVNKIVKLIPKKRQTLLFSATMPSEVEKLAMGLLKKPETVKVDPVTSTVDAIKQSVYFVKHENKKKLLLELLNEKGVSTALVFTRTKSNADMVVRLLTKANIKALAIHGNKSQNARQTALNKFKEGKISVLVATDIAARGIDINELPFVINFNIPEEAETYIHRIGRTGRAGEEGTAISLCCSDELSDWKAIEKLTGNSIQVAESDYSEHDMTPTKRVRNQGRPQRSSRDNSSRRSQGARNNQSRPRSKSNFRRTPRAKQQKEN